ncbi:muscle-specific protein [Anaeramoeba flamelloides]|uniref:Muscle-specific protein n=1 Tax=Anaeramoeba flamelloides TaxID=1746091 RepID=A0AAV7YR90_9EUKA|nr:muscle-specific protein [Anaeramoeba flamelloides]
MTTPFSEMEVNPNQLKKKHDNKLESEALKWIMELTDETDLNTTTDLKSGIALCKLINAIKPGTIRSISKMKIPFKQMDNINKFLIACEKLGVNNSDCFMTVDLYEEKNLPTVLRTIHALGSMSLEIDGFDGPYLGVKIAKKKKIEFTKEQQIKSRSIVPLLTKKAGETSNQSGVFDSSRSIVKVKERGETGEVGLFENSVRKTDNQSGMFDTSRNIVKVKERGETGEVGLFENSVRKTDNQSGIFDNSRNIVKIKEDKK